MFTPRLISAAVAAVYAKASHLIEGTNDREVQKDVMDEAERLANQLFALDGARTIERQSPLESSSTHERQPDFWETAIADGEELLRASETPVKRESLQRAVDWFRKRLEWSLRETGTTNEMRTMKDEPCKINSHKRDHDPKPCDGFTALKVE